MTDDDEKAIADAVARKLAGDNKFFVGERVRVSNKGLAQTYEKVGTVVETDNPRMTGVKIDGDGGDVRYYYPTSIEHA